jgi:hypothetical protein
VGLEGAHTERLGQGEGLAVASVGLCDFRGITMRRNVAEQAQGIRLVAPFLVSTRTPAPMAPITTKPV